MKTFLKIIFAISTGLSLAQDLGSAPKSIEWQTQELRDRLEKQISNVLSGVLKEGEYIVLVDIKASPMDTRLSHLSGDDDKNSRTLSSVKLSDVLDPSEQEDYFLFSKLGLAAPSSLSDSISQQQRGINPLEVQKKSSLFQYLKSVDITLLISDSVEQEIRASVETILKKYPFSLASIKPSLQFQYIPLKKSGPNKLQLLLEETILSLGRAPEFLLPMFVLVLCLWLMLSKFLAAKNASSPVLAPETSHAQNPGAETSGVARQEDAQNTQGDPSPADKAQASFDQSKYINRSIQRFLDYHQAAPLQALLILKKLLASKESDNRKALVLLAQEMSNLEIKELMLKLDPEERSHWGYCIDHERLALEDQIKAAAFIEQQILSNQLSPGVIKDPNAAILVLKTPGETLAETCSSHEDLGAYLISVLSAPQVAVLLDRLEPKKTNRLIDSAMALASSEFPRLEKKLVEVLGSRESQESRSLLHNNVEKLISFSTAKNESAIFRALALAKDEPSFVTLALGRYPYSLVFQLPEEIHRRALENYSNKAKAAFISLFEDSAQRNSFLALAADPGSRVMEMIQLEMQAIERNPAYKKQILEGKAQLLEDFVERCRTLVSELTGPEKDQIVSTLKEWRQSLLGPDLRDETTDQQEVA